MTTYYNYLGQAMAVSATPTVFTYGNPSGHDTVTAAPGPSGVSVNNGNYDTLIASNGDNVFDVSNSSNVVQAASGLTGVKTIISGSTDPNSNTDLSGGYTLPVNVQNLTFYGAGAWGAGNTGDNLIMMGGNDHATLDGGGGNDVLVGGFGENDFEFEVGLGGGEPSHEVFYGFHAYQDTVRLVGASFTSFAQIQAAMTEQTGPDGQTDTVLTIDANDSITFRDTTIAQFQASNFLMHLDTSKLGTLTFDDEFSSLQLYNAASGTGNWQTNYGGDPTKEDTYTNTSNDEKELYTGPGAIGQNGTDLSGYNPFTINNGGGLTIHAGLFSAHDAQYTWGQPYYSGMLTTRGVFMQQYGFFDMRAELPTTLGSWPAFWMSQDPYKGGVEADVMEHLAMYPDTAMSRANDAGTVTGHTTYMPALSGFHDYGMLWTPTTTTFYVDDIAVMEVATPASWDKPMYMLLNLAFGGWGGPIDNANMPTQMQVQYVHVYGLADTPVNVSEGYATYTAPSGVNSVSLLGANQTVTANNAGNTLTSDDQGGNHLIGGTGNDTITLGAGGDTASGGGGTDSFLINTVPTTAGLITDFNSSDQLNLSGLLSSLSYSGSNAVADGVIKFTDDGSGDALVWAWSNSAWVLVTTLDGVSAASLGMNGGVVSTTASGSGGSSSAVVVTGTLTIDAGQTVGFSGPDGAYELQGSATLDIFGSVNAQDTGTNDTLVGIRSQGQGSALTMTVESGGSVSVSAQGAGANAFGFGSGESTSFENDGTLSIYADTTATGLEFDAGGTFTNAGHLTVSGHNGIAAGLFVQGAFQVANSGTVNVSGANDAGAFLLAASGSFSNSGTITATSSNGPSYGVLVGSSSADQVTIDNTGTITGQYAIDYKVGTAPVMTVTNEGRLNGTVILSTAPGDTLHNTGVINGTVYFTGTSGTQTYDGRGGSLAGGLIFASGSGVTGTDIVHLGDDNETVHGGAAALVAFGGSGHDTIVGGAGGATIDGGAGDDTLDGGTGAVRQVDYLTAQVGVTVSLALQGQAQDTGNGVDTLTNFEGLLGSKFGDHLTGDAGNNYIDGEGGNDVMDGGGGVNTIAFGSATTGVTVSLALQGQAQNTGVGSDTLSNFQILLGSTHNDVLEGGGAPSTTLVGHGGVDTFVYKTGDSQVTVADFSVSSGDVIDLSALSAFHSLADVQADATQSGANTLIQFADGGSLILDNVSVSALTAGDFIFASADPGSGSGTGSGSDPGAGTGTGTGSDPGTGTGTGAGSGSDPGAGSGSTGSGDGSSGAGETGGGGGVAHTGPTTVAADFNGDGMGDMFWQNTVNGLTSAWELNGSSATGVSLANASGWKVMDTGNFEGGAYSGDMLLRNTTTGMVDIWQDNNGVLTGHDVAQATLDWQIMGTADFNGDGMSDILWRNEQNGYVSVWQMNGTNVATTYNPGVVGLQWHVIGAGDYVGDGKAEVLWRDSGTGEVNLWTIDGPSANQTHGQTVAFLPLEWTAVGQGDFNGDGRQDVLWHDNATGQVNIWEMNGPDVIASQTVANLGAQWKVVDVVDANGDGNADIIWRDSGTGQAVLWDMNGFNVIHTAVLGTVDNTWQPINHHYDWI